MSEAVPTAFGVIPLTLARSLGDSKSDIRKKAATEVGESVRVYLRDTKEGQTHVESVIQSITTHFTRSVQLSYRRGGLGALSVIAVTVGPPPGITPYLSSLQSAALECVSDQDSTIRFTAVETLFNIVKVARASILQQPFFGEIFTSLCLMSADSEPRVVNANDSLFGLVREIVCESVPSGQFSIPEFIALLTRNMKSTNPYVRQHLMSWVYSVENVPSVNLVLHLSSFLEGLLSMLSDQNAAIVNGAHAMLDSFLVKVKKHSEELDFGQLLSTCNLFYAAREEHTRLLVITWISDLLEIGGARLLGLFHSFLPAVLSMFSDTEEKIRVVAARANDQMASYVAIASTLPDSLLASLISVLEKPEVPTRMGALNWLRLLLDRSPEQVQGHNKDLTPALLEALSDNSLDVVTLVLRVLSQLSRDPGDLARLIQAMSEILYADNGRMMPRAGYIVKRLSLEMGAEVVFKEFSCVLPTYKDKEFVDTFVTTLSILLYTAQETYQLREVLRKGIHADPKTSAVFEQLYRCWCHNAVSTLALCLLCGAYEHAYQLVVRFSGMEVTVSFLVQLDKLVQLLESPAFTHVRVCLLEPLVHPFLVKVMYAIMMLLPQSTAHTILSNRLKCVNTMVLLNTAAYPTGVVAPTPKSAEWAPLLEHFTAVQQSMNDFYTQRTSLSQKQVTQ